MKKLIVLLLALTMVGAAFAQDAKPALTFGLYGDAVANLYDSTSATTGSWSALYSETYFNYKAKDMGFSATTIGSADFFAKVRNWSFYYNVGPVKMLIGKLRETGGARLTSYIDGNGFSTRMANVDNGVELTGTVSGLTASVFVPFGNDDQTVPVDQTYKVAAGLAYAVPNVVTVVGGYRMANKEAWVGADVKAVKGLVARLGYKNVAGTTNYLYATAGSSSLVKGLDLGLDANVNLTASTFGVEAKVEKAFDPYAIGLVASYDNGDGWYKYNGFYVNPYVQMNFAAGDVILGVTYDFASGDIAIPLECEISF